VGGWFPRVKNFVRERNKGRNPLLFILFGSVVVPFYFFFLPPLFFSLSAFSSGAGNNPFPPLLHCQTGGWFAHFYSNSFFPLFLESVYCFSPIFLPPVGITLLSLCFAACGFFAELPFSPLFVYSSMPFPFPPR